MHDPALMLRSHILLLRLLTCLPNLLVSVSRVLPGGGLGVVVDVVTEQRKISFSWIVKNTHNFPVLESNFISQPGGSDPLSSAITCSCKISFTH